MYLILAVDRQPQRYLLLSTHDSASEAMAGYAEAVKSHAEVRISSSPEGLIDYHELTLRASRETQDVQ